MSNNICGAIIMGGLNSRMGYNKKAFLEFKGKPFYQHIAHSMSSFDKIYLSVEDIEIYKDMNLEYELVADIYEKIGPIGGLQSILTKCNEDAFLVLPSDTPLISKEIVNILINKFYKINKCIILSENGRLHPLIAIYKKECLPIINENIRNNNYRLMDILSKIEYEEVVFEDLSIERKVLQNFNSVDEYNKLLKKEMTNE